MNAVENFIAYISELPHIEKTTNLYKGDSELTNIRKHNLKRHLEIMQNKKNLTFTN